MIPLNETHDPALRSWVESAQLPGSDFPIQNLPFAIFRRRGGNEAWRGGVAIGDQILDLAIVQSLLPFEGLAATALAAGAQPQLNDLMQLGAPAWSALRLALSRALRVGSPSQGNLAAALLSADEAEYALPARIGDYTDFYSSIHHATAVGRLFRPDSPLLPNYKWVPIGYHGRSSSIGVSGQSFPRPRGQTLPRGAETPVFGASQRLDYELELGLFIGTGNQIGEPIPLAQAESHIFGICLLNDWSARDLQAWETLPLGPFLGKNFATTISPWIVMLEALAPYRMPFDRPSDDPRPLPYLHSADNQASGAIDIQLEVAIQTSTMRREHVAAQPVSRSGYRHAYWTAAQLVTHHSVNGCNLRPGDLLGTGTQSGPVPEEAGSLLELSVGGKLAIDVGGESRRFLEDGDIVVMRGWCEKVGAARIGFGQVSGKVLPARH